MCKFFIILTVVCTFVYGSDSLVLEYDPFSTTAFDSVVTTSTITDSKNQIEYLPGAFFLSEGTIAYSTDSNGYGADGRMYGKAYLKVSKADAGALYVGINFNYFLLAAADNEYYRSFYLRQSPDLKKIYSSLAEFHYSFDIKKIVFVRIGSQLISWGSTYFWSPEDFINLQKSSAPTVSAIDSRAGKPGIRLHLPVGTSNLFVFTDFSSLVTQKNIASLEDSLALAVRLDGTKYGARFGTIAYLHKNRPLQIGFDATGALLGSDVYSEIALLFPVVDSEKTNIALSVGGSRLFGEEKNYTGRVEFYYNARGRGDVPLSSLPIGSFVPLYGGKWYGYAEIASSKLFTNLASGSLSAYANLADGSYSTTMQLTFDLPAIIPFTVYGKYFGGKKDRELTVLYDGPAIVGGVRLSAEF